MHALGFNYHQIKTWTEGETESYAPVTDSYDSYWKEVEPTPRAPETGKTGPDDSDYWDAARMFESFSFRRLLRGTVCET